MTGLIVDSFAGGGGASTGIEWALGRSPDIAINHDEDALAMHAANHPATHHIMESIWQVDPYAVTGGKPVDLLWMSPDCRHFSRAKGGVPVSKSVRGLADVGLLWARVVKPAVIMLENVEEFETWGPLDAEGRPDPARKGQDFTRWVRALEALGYAVDWRELRACDYGAPTIRKRLFLVARRDGCRILWPAPTHGDPRTAPVKTGALKPWRTAAEIIDWALPCPSIFLTRDDAKTAGLKVIRPLAAKTMARIAQGFKRHVLDRPAPFVVIANHGGDGFRGQALDQPLRTVTAARDAIGLVAPFLSPRYQEKTGQNARTRAIDEPCATIVPGGNVPGSVVAAYLAQHNGGVVGRPADVPVSTITSRATQINPVCAYLAALRKNCEATGLAEPVSTIAASGNHHALTVPFVQSYYSTGGQDAAADEPLRTVPTKARFAPVTGEAQAPPLAPWQEARARQVAEFLRAHGHWDDREFVTLGNGDLVVWDIGMRMLTPRELARAQGLPETYDLTAGGRLTETSQRHKIGNSVSPYPAAALVRANMIDARALPPVRRRRATLPEQPQARQDDAPMLIAAE